MHTVIIGGPVLCNTIHQLYEVCSVESMAGAWVQLFQERPFHALSDTV